MDEDRANLQSAWARASFLGLILALALAVPFSLDQAQSNTSLTSAISALMK